MNITDNQDMYSGHLFSRYVARKRGDMTWNELADEMNSIFGLSFSPDKYRKEATRLFGNLSTNDEFCENSETIIYDSDKCDVCDNSEDTTDFNYINEESEELRNILHDIKIERYKLLAERTLNNANTRLIARELTIYEIAEMLSKSSSDKKCLKPFTKIDDSGSKTAVIQLSDWHYGIEINNAWNKYNVRECVERVSSLFNLVVNYITNNDIKHVVIVNQSDLISGNIHLQLRVLNQENVMELIKDVSELLSEFIYGISKYATVDYYDCLDNHSRFNANKKESIQLESLTEITHWFVKHMFKDHENVTIHENEFSRDIITFNLYNWNFAAVHGDLDSPNKVVSNISLATRRNYDVILSAHNHHFSCDELNMCMVISNPSLMGTDDYAQSLRLSSRPAQNMIIVSNINPIDCIKPIYV